jgi:hypothetical protein
MSQPPSIESVIALNGRIFAMLSPDEVKVLEFYRDQGRKYGIALSIINQADPTELAKATSKAAADDILRRANSVVTVKKIMADEAHKAPHFIAETIQMVKETITKN